MVDAVKVKCVRVWSEGWSPHKILIDFYKKICYNIYVKIKKEIDINSKLKVISGFV